jgi:hypothetical protein
MGAGQGRIQGDAGGQSLMRPAGPGVSQVYSGLVSPKEELSLAWARVAGNTCLTSHEAAVAHETGVLSRRLVAGLSSPLPTTQSRAFFRTPAAWDAAGAEWFGYPTVWVKRANVLLEEFGMRPDVITSDLSGLVDFVAGPH